MLVFLGLRLDCSRCDDASMQNMHIVYVAVMSRSEINVLQHVVKGWLLSICFQEIVISLLCSSSMGSGKQQGQGFPPSFDKKLNPKPVS